MWEKEKYLYVIADVEGNYLALATTKLQAEWLVFDLTFKDNISAKVYFTEEAVWAGIKNIPQRFYDDKAEFYKEKGLE